MASSSLLAPAVPALSEASPKGHEKKRFTRADKDKNGLELDELLVSRRTAFAKLDKNGNKALPFEEWAIRTIDKFEDATKTGRAKRKRQHLLRRIKKRCSC